MPISEVITESAAPAGFEAHGLTVSRGNVIDDFPVTVLGVLNDGVGIGHDMIIVNVHDYPAMDAKAHGIWAGMSGSPVYTNEAQPRLIGAVAFGLALGPSTIGGVTPADDMADVLGLEASTPPAQSVGTTAALRQKMVATGAVSAKQAGSPIQRLPIPLAVSGVQPNRLDKFADRLPGSERFLPYAAGAAAAPTGDPSQIVPGGNFAAAVSYGDLTAAGVGTTTARCNDSVVAFGHPFNFDGPTALSVHNATAIVVQDDPTLFPFKLANIGGTVGTLDQDRLSGIRALLGTAPDPIEVTSNVNDDPDPEGELTNVNRTRDVPLIAAFHLLGNIESRIDRIGGGRSDLGWTVRGSAGGKQFSLTRNNKFAHPFDISFFSIFEMLDMLATLNENPFTEVTFKDVDITADVQAPFREYRITGLELRVGSEWEPVDTDKPLRVDPGATIRVRALLALDRSTAAIPPVEFSLKVPANAAGKEGSMDITGGAEGGGNEEAPDENGEPNSFDELLDTLRNAPQNDQVIAELRLFTEEKAPPPVASARKTVDESIRGTENIPLLVSGGEEPPPCQTPPCEEPPPCETPPCEGPRGPTTIDLGGRSVFKLATALRRGIRITLRSSEAGRVTLKALVDRKTARRFKLKNHPKGPVVVAAGSKRVLAGRNTVKLAFTKKARKRLREAKRVKLAIRATLRSAEGNSVTDRFSLTLKRKLR